MRCTIKVREPTTGSVLLLDLCGALSSSMCLRFMTLLEEWKVPVEGGDAEGNQLPGIGWEVDDGNCVVYALRHGRCKGLQTEANGLKDIIHQFLTK